MAEIVRAYTPAEAAAVSEVDVKSVHNAIDKRIVEGGMISGSSAPGRRTLSQDDLLQLKLWYGVGSTLTADRRQRLFEAIRAEPTAATVRADDLLIVDVDRARSRLLARVRKLDEAEAAIHRNKSIGGGEPVFKDTRVPVRMIAAMLAQGATATDILEGYPALTEHMLELAEIWTAAHPALGRPKKLADDRLMVKSIKRTPLKGDPRTRSSGPTA